MKVIKQIATIISYNIFQMNGLTKQTPYSDNSKGNIQLNLFDDVNNQELQGDMFAFVKDWKNKALVSMDSISKGDEMMKFDVVIGNPPYQEEAQGTSTKDMPIYHKFIDSAFEIGEKACLITPARFLFNAGGTPKQWNREFLKNPHVKVPYYAQNSAKVFPNTSIKGGIAITIFDKQKDYGAIETFTSFEELNSIMKKVNVVPEQSLAEIVTNRGAYRYSDLIYKDYPDAMKRVSDRRLASNAFIKLQELFYNDIPNDGNEYKIDTKSYVDESFIEKMKKFLGKDEVWI